MAFVAYRATTFDLTGTNDIQRGSTFVAIFQVKDAAGNPQNLSEWVAYSATPVCQFKTDYDPPGVTTGCPQPTMSYLNGGVAGEIQMVIDASATASASVSSGRYDIEIRYSSTERTRVFEGAWTIDKEVTTS
jgi:hypothetical protein